MSIRSSIREFAVAHASTPDIPWCRLEGGTFHSQGDAEVPRTKYPHHELNLDPADRLIDMYTVP